MTSRSLRTTNWIVAMAEQERTDKVTKRVIRVSRNQVESAQTLVRIAGGPDKVNPVIAKIAQARRAPKDEPEAKRAS